jgi:3-isopropylmalate/(R)-2-methylmalate dehydratase small subunit
MKREPFSTIDAVALPVPQANVDTDQIVPARYLQKPRSADFGEFLFQDVRVRPDGTADPTFPLVRPEYRDARVVVGGANFGCGSSREHAVWALYDYGIRAAIAPAFGDIFRSNAIKNGLLPIVLPAGVVARLLEQLAARPGARVRVDLERQEVAGPDGVEHAFDIDPFSKRCLRDGIDELDYTLALAARIEAFERQHEGG